MSRSSAEGATMTTTDKTTTTAAEDGSDGCRDSYRFDLDNHVAWRNYLREHGYVVLRAAATPEEVQTAKDLIWTDLEAAEEGVHRGDPSTWWRRWRIPGHGIVSNLAQTAGPWYIRGLEGVQRAFSLIWGTNDLITSMDAVLLWRPWWYSGADNNNMWKPVTEGLHLDQNPFTKPNLDCIQGMMPLISVTPAVGGLQVVPGSHTDESKARWKAENPDMVHAGEFVIVSPKSSHAKGAILLEADAGDLVLWDSRTIHGGKVGPGPEATSPPVADLARMSVTVAMTPRSWACEEVQQVRREGFEEGYSFNHCPHEAGTSSGTIHATRKPEYAKFTLTKRQRAVL